MDKPLLALFPLLILDVCVDCEHPATTSDRRATLPAKNRFCFFLIKDSKDGTRFNCVSSIQILSYWLCLLASYRFVEGSLQILIIDGCIAFVIHLNR